MKILLVNLFCFICLGAVAADMFGEDDANPSLFGIQLGQTISVDDAELFSRYTLCTNGTYRHSQDIYIPDQWECYGFTPEQKFQDPQFSRHRIFIDGASRQVVAVDAHFDSVILPLRWDNPPSAQFTNLLERVFREYGQCETRLSYELWSSGIIYRTTFFTTSGAGIVISHHQQFGGSLCLYRVSSIIEKSRVGMVLPDSYQAPSPQEQIFFGKYMRLHPALELYEQYRSRRRTAIGILEKHFEMSAAKLKSETISQPEWEHVVFEKGTGRFGLIVMNGKDSAWKMQAYVNNKIAVECHLHIFDSTAKAYDYGLDLLTNRLLPGEMLCEMFSLAEDFPDICLVASTLESYFGSHPTVILLRANSVLECEFNGHSGDYAAEAVWLLDFFVKKTGTGQDGDNTPCQ